MKTSLFLLFIFSTSFFSHAEFTAVSGSYPTSNQTCSDFSSCYGIFENLPQYENYSLNGNAFIIGEKVYAEYMKPSGSIMTKYITFTYSEDCYISTSFGMACDLSCNTENSCFAYGSSLCSGYISSYDYDDPANWAYSCAELNNNSPPINIDQLPDESIITSTVKGDRGLRGQTGESGVDGIDGKDGVDGLDGIDGKDGANGVDGLNGIDGKEGANGLAGLNGIDGKDGANGLAGLNGIDGKDGVNGLDGKDGVVDAQTLDQINGNSNNISDLSNDLSFLDQSIDIIALDVADNKQELNFVKSSDDIQDGKISVLEVAINSFPTPVDGKDGIDGQDGRDGLDGKDGVDGKDGINGSDGADGVSGTNGIDGSDGIAGINGTNGVDGADGSVLNLQSVADAINDGFSYLKGPVSNSSNPANSDAYSSFFSQESIEINNQEVQNYKDLIKSTSATFKDTVSAQFSFSASSSGYQSRNLDLGSWGNHDVSISRITQHFGGLANIIYFFATLLALSIIFSGIKL